MAMNKSPARANRERYKVLIKVTPKRLAELVGEDTAIGVSAKELKLILTKQKSCDVLAEAGL